jgi:hypothetical protein
MLCLSPLYWSHRGEVAVIVIVIVIATTTATPDPRPAVLVVCHVVFAIGTIAVDPSIIWPFLAVATEQSTWHEIFARE